MLGRLSHSHSDVLQKLRHGKSPPRCMYISNQEEPWLCLAAPLISSTSFVSTLLEESIDNRMATCKWAKRAYKSCILATIVYTIFQRYQHEAKTLAETTMLRVGSYHSMKDKIPCNETRKPNNSCFDDIKAAEEEKTIAPAVLNSLQEPDSCRRSCSSRPNIIVLSQPSSAGLNDRKIRVDGLAQPSGLSLCHIACAWTSFHDASYTQSW